MFAYCSMSYCSLKEIEMEKKDRGGKEGIYDMVQNLGKKFFQSLLDQFFASNSPL